MIPRTHSIPTVAAVLLAAACASTPPPPAPPVPPSPREAVTAPPPAPEGPATYVLMLSGGGSPSINYQSHLLHLQSLRELLLRGGISASRISILASDGSDPAPDLATREVQPEPDFWRLAGTRLERWLETPTTLSDSKLPGVSLEPASKASVGRWFEDAGRRLHAGDTLVLYVTDHGTRRGADPLDNQITLWGTDASISVRELGALLAKLDPGVRIVSLMSQCFSGGFAALASLGGREGDPTGSVCGYFSSTAERPAYGCFPENRGKANVGHSFEFVRALARTGRFREAHDAVLVDDATPDVPLRSSDTYLESLVRKDAELRGVTLVARADELLHEAFLDPARWQTESRLIDRVAQAAGSFSPRTLAELDELGKRLPENDSQLTSVSRAWRSALADANASNLEQFIATRADWAERIAEPALAKLSPSGARLMTSALLSDLAQFTAQNAALEKRILALNTRGDIAESASYRTQVRLAFVLRMRSLLLSIAGRVYLAESGKPAQKAALEGLLSCEDLSLEGIAPPPTSPPSPTPSPLAAAHPSFEEEAKLAESALPGWMGITFKDPSDELRIKQHLPPGASMVSLVFPESAAKAAGFEVGDIVIGTPSEPFTSRNQIRQWTMLSDIGKSAKLVVLRDGNRRQISITPRPYPMKWPSLPGPMQVGAAAPKVDLRRYRGALATNLHTGKKHLLYFWATWCGPCKAALPELLAFEKERKIPIVAVTDEDPKVLDAFFKKFASPFPDTIAVDELRRAFVAYGVSGTPAFVLVDAKGKVAGYQIGYDGAAGLALPEWTWSGRKVP